MQAGAGWPQHLPRLQSSMCPMLPHLAMVQDAPIGVDALQAAMSVQLRRLVRTPQAEALAPTQQNVQVVVEVVVQPAGGACSGEQACELSVQHDAAYYRHLSAVQSPLQQLLCMYTSWQDAAAGGACSRSIISLSACPGRVQTAYSSAQPVGLGLAVQRGAGLCRSMLPAAAVQLWPVVLTSSAISEKSDRSCPARSLKQSPLVDDGRGRCVSVDFVACLAHAHCTG